MTELHNELLFTTVYSDISAFHPRKDGVYLAREGVEERSHHGRRFGSQRGIRYLRVVEELETSTRISGAALGSASVTLPLRGCHDLQSFWANLQPGMLYLDITGLHHHTWMPLLRSAIEFKVSVQVVYVEPATYQASTNPTEGQVYDLSERIRGIAPIPGLASFARVTDKLCFIPLLGFDGTRVAYLLEQVQPPGDKVIPIVGAPGFRAEYPFVTYMGNRIPLQQSEAWRHIRFAEANCPFSLYYLLRALSKQYVGHHFKIAPVGTKPHALGALLFVLQDTATRELVYDHPIRKAMATKGHARLLTYDVTEFIKQ